MGKFQKPTCRRPAGNRGAPFALCSGSAVVVGRGCALCSPFGRVFPCSPFSVCRHTGFFHHPRRVLSFVPAFDARSRAMLARNRSRNRARHPKIAQAGIPRLCPSHISPKPRPRAALCTRTRHARAASTLPEPKARHTYAPPMRRARPTRTPREPHGCHNHAPLSRRASAEFLTHIVCRTLGHPPTLRR